MPVRPWLDAGSDDSTAPVMLMASMSVPKLPTQKPPALLLRVGSYEQWRTVLADDEVMWGGARVFVTGSMR